MFFSVDNVDTDKIKMVVLNLIMMDPDDLQGMK